MRAFKVESPISIFVAGCPVQAQLGQGFFLIVYQSQNPHPNVAQNATLGWGTQLRSQHSDLYRLQLRAAGPDNRVFPKLEGAPFKLSLSGAFSVGPRTVAVRNTPARSLVRAVHCDSISTAPISPVAWGSELAKFGCRCTS